MQFHYSQLLGRKILPVFVIVGIALGTIPTQLHAEPAPTTSDIEALKKSIEAKNQEIKALEEEAKKYSDARTEAQKKQKTLSGELATLKNQLSKLSLDLRITETKVSRTEEIITGLSLELNKLENLIEENKNSMATVLQTLYADELHDPMFLVLSHETFSDAFSLMQYSSTLNQSLFLKLKSTLSLKAYAESKKQETEEQKQTLENLAAKLENQKALTQSTKSEKDTLLKKTKNQEVTYQKLLRDAESRKQEVQQDIEELEEMLRRAIDPSSLPPARSDYFALPIQGRLSSGYGERKHPLGLGIKFHNGIDIAAPVGTEIYAPYGGTVIAVGNSDTYCYRGAYGKWLLIDHGNNLATMYAHLSVHKLKAGQIIEKGDLVGLVGNTGSSTGPHLHFTVYDRRTVTIKGSRVCGPLPYGGSIDPLDYLSYN